MKEMKEMKEMNKYYGKYRGTVFNNIDPEQCGRIQAFIPDVLGIAPSSWAMPCFPIAGKQMGAYMIPQIGSGVWIEFEQGDPDFPIWAGCFYGIVAEVPPLALAGNPASPNIVLQTSLQNTLVISDLPKPYEVAPITFNIGLVRLAGRSLAPASSVRDAADQSARPFCESPSQ